MPLLPEVCITGYGLLSALPEEAEQRWHLLNNFSAPYPTVDSTTFAPYAHHPLVNFNAESQISSHRDRRTLGQTMQAAIYTAGVALDNAQLKNNADLLKDMQIIVAIRGGERDVEADRDIIALCDPNIYDYQEKLNQALMSQLRPTLFLSQLPNLLAANIALLFGATGSSLTLMGGEMAGAQAIELAYQRILSGQAQRVLVGGVSYNQSHEIIMAFARAKKLLPGFLPLWQRQEGGLCLGSGSGFLVLESLASAQNRQATILGKLTHVGLSLQQQNNWQTALMQRSMQSLAIITMTSGDAQKLAQERLCLQQLQQNYPLFVRNAITATGTLLEATLPVGIILALQCLEKQKLFAPLSACDIEQNTTEHFSQIWVNALSHIDGHALMCVEAA